MKENYIKYISIEDSSKIFNKYSEQIDLIDNINYDNTSDLPKVRKNIIIKFSVNEPDLFKGQRYTLERIENNNCELNSYEEVEKLIKEVECKNIILEHLLPIYKESLKTNISIDYGFIIDIDKFNVDLSSIQRIAAKSFKAIKKVIQKDNHIHFVVNFKILFNLT